MPSADMVACQLNSLSAGRCDCGLKCVIIKKNEWYFQYFQWILPSGECHRTYLMINQHWFRWWFGATRQQAMTWATIWPGLTSSYRVTTSQGFNLFFYNRVSSLHLSNTDKWYKMQQSTFDNISHRDPAGEGLQLSGEVTLWQECMWNVWRNKRYCYTYVILFKPLYCVSYPCCRDISPWQVKSTER